jgi:dipeptidyl aminopeptidase/acylaminoacyl peptidase
MRWIAVGVACIALSAGLASANPAQLRPTLSFTIAPGVSDYGFAPLGGGICLGNRRVTDPKDDGGASWSPDGRRVAFDRRTGTLTADVFVVNTNGSRLRNLSRGSDAFSWAPTWTPDGTRVVYIASNRDRDELMTIRPDGTDPRPIPNTSFDPNMQLSAPDVSPDGEWIGYTLNDGLHVVRIDGSGGRLLLGNATGFTWSADGTHIAFTREDDLAIANADGSHVRFVTRTPDASEGGAAWSPDGSKLLYISVDIAPRGTRGPGDHIYLADEQGEHRTELRAPSGLPAWGPAWRPAAPPVKRARACAILGTRHGDTLVGTPKADLIFAGRGDDTVHGRGGDDIVVGDDPFTPRPGRDRLYGGPGRDFIDSYDSRRDLVDGGAGRDRGMFDERDRVRSIEQRG